MAVEGSSTFTSELSVNNTSQKESESEPADDVAEVQESSVKRKTEKKYAGEKWAQRQKKAVRCPVKYHSRLAEFFYRNVGTEYGTGQRKI